MNLSELEFSFKLLFMYIWGATMLYIVKLPLLEFYGCTVLGWCLGGVIQYCFAHLRGK